MTTKTYYGKLDCFSANSSIESISNEYYRSFCDFMSYLTQSNVASLVAWNSGSGAVSASFNQRGYWDQNNAYGLGAHSVWKFPSSSTRPFDWYLYTQTVTGSAAINQAFNQPISGYTDATNFNNSFRGILMQAAVYFSGATSLNPWRGTGVSDGNDTAGNPRWSATGSNQILYVLPRSNDFGGTSPMPAQKSNGIALGGLLSTSMTKLRFHFIFDGDALVVLTNEIGSTNAGNYNITYVGPFELRTNLSGTGIGNGSHGFIMNTNTAATPAANTFAFATTFGDTAGSTTTANGGIAVPVGGTAANQPGSSSRGAVLDTIGTSIFSVTMQPNFYTNQFDEFPITVGGNETSFQGTLGNLNQGLIRMTIGTQTHDVTGDNSRAIFGGSTVVAAGNGKVSVPWTGSLAPGISASRTGSNFTWTKDYG